MPAVTRLTSLPTVAFAVLIAATLTAPAQAQQKPAAKPVQALTPQDYIDIQQLLNRYAFALDTCSNNGYDYADLYTTDGIFYWGIGGRKSVGREQLAEAAGGGKGGCKKMQTANRENPISNAHDR